MFKRLNIKAISWGLVTGVIANICVGIAIGILHWFQYIQDGSATYLVIELFGDILSWLLAGMATYKFARSFPAFNIAATIIIFILFSSLLSLLVSWERPLWFKLLDTVIIVLAICVGGTLQRIILNRNSTNG